jgi:hypothetical protein
MSRLVVLACTVAAALLASTPAIAGKCDAIVAKGTKQTGVAAAATYKELLACDKAEAEAAYNDFLTKTGDVDGLTALSLAAINAKAYAPVWNSLEKIKDYSMRDEAAKAVGASCAQNAEVVVFLKGAYFGLRDIQFAQWDDAYVACPSADVDAWLDNLIKAPPERSYDEKYNTLLSIWTKRKGKDGLTTLKTAAIAAANKNGPFNSILDAMDRAVQPAEIGASPSEEDRKLLESALVDVAASLQPDKAKMLAEKLFNTGATQAAISLLPKLHADKVQPGGGFLYGVAAIESCDKQAVVHYAQVTEPAKRWTVQSELEAPARAFAPRLKCTSEGPWPVLVTAEPVKDAAAVEAWQAGLVQQWTAKGMETKARAEKAITLP